MECSLKNRPQGLGDGAEALGRAPLATLIAASIGMRLALIGVNQAEYTDGILQLTLFTSGNPYWPPAYSALACGLGALIGDAELAGKIVSAVLGGLAVWPIAWLGARLGRRRSAGIWAGAVFLALPEPLRWGVRVMTDAMFLTLFAGAIALMAPRPGFRAARLWRLLAATVAAVAAALTRYQGALLAFPLAWEIGRAFLQWRQAKKTDSTAEAPGAQRAACWLWPLAAQALWLAVPAWILSGGFEHARQFADRSGAWMGMSRFETLLSYWNLAECYGYLMPYSLTPGVFLAFMAGLCWRGAWSDRFARWFWGLLALAGALLAAAQAAFGIFEFRYMLPLAAFVAPAAGAGMVRIEAALAERKRLASLIQGAILAPALLFSLASLLLQREAFGDIKQAARAAARMAAPDQRVFSNERYNALFSTVKTSYWLGRDALADPEMERFQSLYSAGGDAPGPDAAPFRAGDWLIVSSVYAGGPQMISDYLAWLSERYTLASKGRFDAVITPLLPDLMAIPGTHGSPLAWFYRYAPQHFSTLLIQVQGIRQ